MMIYRKTMPILQEKARYGKHGIGNQRVTIPIEIRDKIKTTSNDFIEWEADTEANTLIGRLVKNAEKKSVPIFSSTSKKIGWFPKDWKPEEK